MERTPLDLLGRPLRDLRISVTDRCNFRCTYCMPKEIFGAAYPFVPRTEILSFEEIARLAGIFAGLGVQKFRLTGGEPLLRKNLDRLIALLAADSRVQDLALTTNGSLLAPQAAALRQAGLRRLTVSLDSLDPRTFAAMADTTLPLASVLAGIEAAVQAGFSPVKINMVVKRGVNDHEIPAMVRRFGTPSYILRFIEYMDVGNTNGWRMEQVVTAREIEERLAEEFELQPLPANYGGEVARRFRVEGAGEIGFITSVTQPFCSACTRARLSADGRLFTCLFASEGRDLRPLLRSGQDDQELTAAIRRLWQQRSDRYSELRQPGVVTPKAEMSLLGG